MMEQAKQSYIGYEYKKITTTRENLSWYLDCYESFGWVLDDNAPAPDAHTTVLALKRDRKIINKAELTRLQRNFEACADEIHRLEYSKHSQATMWAITVGILGTAFIAGSVFAVTHNPPIIWLCILLAVPGFLGWAAPFFLYRRLCDRRTAQIQPLIEAKQDEIYEICQKGHDLL